ncbi:hypothetical protein LCGC14_2013030 [marine sediment metagenome]|uniref:Uncharacterized protein n=1 Tax=marine sediment metagenome TaxID=412755 RepID=A0A0F9FM76_9ZZZZ
MRPTGREVPSSASADPSRSRKAAWPIVLGVMALFCGGVGLVGIPLAAAIKLFQADRGHRSVSSPDWWLTYRMVSFGVIMILSAILAIAGICLLRRRPAGRALHLVYGVLGTVYGLTCLLMVPFSLPKHVWPVEVAARIVLGCSEGSGILIYSVFVLIWFARPVIRQQVEAWRTGHNTGARQDRNRLNRS